MTSPKYSNLFSFGNLITILFGVMTATGMFFVMDARSQNNQDDIVEIKRDMDHVQFAIVELQKDQVRGEEQYNTVIQLLAKIDTRLERIEAQK